MTKNGRLELEDNIVRTL